MCVYLHQEYQGAFYNPSGVICQLSMGVTEWVTGKRSKMHSTTQAWWVEQLLEKRGIEFRGLGASKIESSIDPANPRSDMTCTSRLQSPRMHILLRYASSSFTTRDGCQFYNPSEGLSTLRVCHYVRNKVTNLDGGLEALNIESNIDPANPRSDMTCTSRLQSRRMHILLNYASSRFTTRGTCQFYNPSGGDWCIEYRQ